MGSKIPVIANIHFSTGMMIMIVPMSQLTPGGKYCEEIIGYFMAAGPFGQLDGTVRV